MTAALDPPRDLPGALEVPQTQMEARLRELIALELFRERRIPSGKGAELLETSKLAFVRVLSQHGIGYFIESPEDMMRMPNWKQAEKGRLLPSASNGVCAAGRV